MRSKAEDKYADKYKTFMQYNFPERERINHVDNFINNVIDTKTKKFKP